MKPDPVRFLVDPVRRCQFVAAEMGLADFWT